MPGLAVGPMDGLVLAGGQARRMQPVYGAPVDKGLLMLDGQPLVARARAYLAPHVQRVYISTNRNAPLYAAYGEPVPDEADLYDAGPLAGVASGLARCRADWLLVLPVDVVLLPPDLPHRLAQAASAGDTRLAHAVAGGRTQPLCMLLHKSLQADLQAWLRSGERKVSFWQRRHEPAQVVFEGPEPWFFNVNSPEDLAQAGSWLHADGV